MRIVKMSTEAEFNIEQISSYLKHRWSKKTAENFLNEIQKTLELLQTNPSSFEYSPDVGHYKVLVKKRTLLFYSFNKSEVNIVKAFDARVNYEDEEKWK